MSIQKISDYKAHEMSDGVLMRMLHGEKLSFVYTELKKGAIIAKHHHNNEQIIFLLKGRTKVIIDSIEHEMGPLAICNIPPNISHSAIALEDTTVVDVFSPVRLDFKKISDPRG